MDRRKSINEYNILTQVGEGAFGQVFLVEEKDSKKKFAIKVLNKQRIVKLRKQDQVKKEREILNRLQHHPHIIKLHATFEDKTNIYFKFEHCPFGTLSDLLQIQGKLSEEVAAIYAAEIVSVLEDMHQKGIIHRDLKPQNILLDSNLHLKIVLKAFNLTLIQIDFGDASEIKNEDGIKKQEDKSSEDFFDQDSTNNSTDRKGTFVGTAFYVSPEMLSDTVSLPASDLWALGCIIYQILTGEVPFKGESDYSVFKRILEGTIEYPEGVLISENAKDLISSLLNLEPSKRLGGGAKDSNLSMQDLKNHAFFKNINFMDLKTHKIDIDKSNMKEENLTKSREQLMEEELDRSSKSNGVSSSILFSGELKKRNKFYMKQIRFFVLRKEGRIDYYKDGVLFKGSINLTKETKIIKSGKDRFQIITPSRKYHICETDEARLVVDTWISKIKQLIEKL